MKQRILIACISFTLLYLIFYPSHADSMIFSITSSDRVMVIAPHPDDEAISASGVIGYCLRHHIPVKVVIVTHGDDAIGMKRYNESLEAMRKLGLYENITFLDYPLGVDNLLFQNWDKPYTTSTGVNSTGPFSHNPYTPYTGEDLSNELIQIINDFKPTIIIAPDPNDEYPGHWSTRAFVEYAITKMNYNCTIYGYLVHFPDWPPTWQNQNDYISPPPNFPARKWVEFPLTKEDGELKVAVIKSYKSQFVEYPILGDYSMILKFIRKNELFSVCPTININPEGRPAHESDSPETIFRDPLGDVYSKKLIPRNYLDLTGLGFEIDDNVTWISIETVSRVSENESYGFHLITFNDDGETKKIDIQVKNYKAYYQMFSGVNVNSGTPIKTVIKDNMIAIGIPTNLLNKSSKVMISADVIGWKCFDRTAWRILDIDWGA